jgi:hypothetical protein
MPMQKMDTTKMLVKKPVASYVEKVYESGISPAWGSELR